ncbi:hypothetical protein EWM62_01970 [Mucilaginibacter terrigena]|uniref:Damage-inducible protein DinB n=1 Tax=Mucilaginibacter terrigena TaxID=2492395 RepID=A0A4Q5LRX7_9SPHI|nr:DinB family protein [Mucilaginibacter terrigena]RYU92224.1 hypothetical protein EWM62_01970 [Mucilaginibacter terrigena]
MKSYFIRLFNYDQFANRQIADLIVKTGINGKPVKLMTHLLVAEEVWLSRCMGQHTKVTELWPDWDAASYGAIIDKLHHGWITFLNSLNEAGFDKIITYRNLQGQLFETALCDILAHVINHGTHTRAQAGQHLKLTGDDKLPITDYVYYLRQINPAP